MSLPEVNHVIRKMKNGYTHPFKVECIGLNDSYIIKAMSNDIEPKALFNELICGRLAKQLGMFIPDFCIVNLSQNVINNNPEMIEFGLKPGPCFASKYRRSRGISQSYINASKNIDRLPEIILFDQIILNVDRCDRDNNILFDTKTRSFFLIDHTNTFDLAQIWDPIQLKKRMNNIPPYTTKDVHGVCYDSISKLVTGESNFKRIKDAVQNIDYDSLIENVPIEWGIPKEDQEFIIDFLKSRISEIDGIINELRKRLFTNWRGIS